MKHWVRKVSVIFVAIMTLGVYVPQIPLDTDAEESNEAVSSNTDVNEDVSVVVSEPTVQEENTAPTIDSDVNHFSSDIKEKAKEQTITKLGPKIATQVEVDFMNDILPKIEESLSLILADADDDVLPYYSITERPSEGFGEKIFNIYDNRTEKDIARFHVRRDNRPLEGYWFNFHYHLSKDGFENHHEIGEIYWDKNIPPKWMA